MDPPKKKRRTPFSCTVCRRKKIKCDRSKPICRRCQISNLECVYTAPTLFSNITERNIVKDSFNNGFMISLADIPQKANGNAKMFQGPSTSKLAVDNGRTALTLCDNANGKIKEIENLQNQINRLKNSFDSEIECISLVLDYDNSHLALFRSKQNVRFAATSSFSLTSIWRRDPLMQKFIRNFFLLKKKVTKIKDAESKKNNRFVEIYYPKSSAKTGKSKFDYIPNLESFHFLNTQLVLKKKNKSLLNPPRFVERVEEILPPYNIICYYIDYFFTNLYPFIPIFDEFIFKANLLKILTVENDNHVKIKLFNKLDQIRVSILLILLRLSYISIYLESKLGKVDNQVYKDILQFPINSDINSLVQSSLINANFLIKTSVETYQLLLLNKFHQTHAPEDGDGYFGTNGTIFLGLIYSTAKSIGLKNLFDYSFTDTFSDVQLKTNTPNGPPHLQMNLLDRGKAAFVLLWKKLWWQSLSFDLYQSMIEGTELTFNHDPLESTNSVPQIDENLKSVENFETEKLSIGIITNFSKINHEITILLNKLNNLKSKPTLYEVDNHLNKIFETIDNLEDSDDHFTTANISIASNVNTIKLKMEVYNAMLIIQYSLLLHCEHICEKKEDLKIQAINRFKKLLPDYFSKWIWLTEKFISVWFDNLNQSLVDDDRNENEDRKENDDYLNYAIILCSLLNNVFPKIMLIWCFVSIRLLTFNYKFQNDENFRNLLKLNDDKVKQVSRMYSNLLLLMKTLIVIQEKMSKFYYISLRNCSMLKQLVEWFEAGGKFAFNDSGYDYLTNHDINEISEDFKNKSAINVVTEFILSMESVILENLNLKLELIIKTYKIENINAIHKQAFSKYENNENSTTFDFNNNDKINNVDNSINDNNGNNNNNVLNDLNEFANNKNEFYVPNPFELNDWDDVTKWFSQSSLFGSAELDSLNQEFLEMF